MNEYSVKDNWGEALEKHTSAVACILDTETSDVTVLDFLDENFSYSQPVWLSEDTMAIIGIKHDRFRLGLIYCNNRECAVFKVSLKSKFAANMGLPVAHYTGLFVSPDYKLILTLQNSPYGAHMKDKSLISIDPESCATKTILKEVFVESVPYHPWVDDNHFCVNLYQKSSIRGAVVDLESSDVDFLLSEAQYEGSYIIQDFAKDWFAVIKTSFASPESVAVLKRNSNFVLSKFHIKFNFFTKKIEFEDWGYYFVGPADQSVKRPCILFPHGGPHVLNTDVGTLPVSFFATMGFNVVLINYRGSLGFTPASLVALPGELVFYCNLFNTPGFHLESNDENSILFDSCCYRNVLAA